MVHRGNRRQDRPPHDERLVSEFTPPSGGSNPLGIVAGPDGALWFTEQSTNKIGRVTTSGAFTEFANPNTAASPRTIALGADGNFWFGEAQVDRIGASR